MFCRLKAFRRVAMRYDRLATNFLAAVCLARNRQLLVMSPDPRADRASAGPFLFVAPFQSEAHLSIRGITYRFIVNDGGDVLT